jgi:hypothetical protein
MIKNFRTAGRAPDARHAIPTGGDGSGRSAPPSRRGRGRGQAPYLRMPEAYVLASETLALLNFTVKYLVEEATEVP